MQTFKLYFEFYGKYFTTAVEANSLFQAKEMIKDRIKFVSEPKKIEKDEDITDNNNIFGDKDIFNNLMDIVNGKK